MGLSAVHRMLLHHSSMPGGKFTVGRDPQLVLAGVPVVKCTVGGLAIDISANQLRGLTAVCFMNAVDQAIGHNHLFKRSILAVKVSTILRSSHLALPLAHLGCCWLSVRGPLPGVVLPKPHAATRCGAATRAASLALTAGCRVTRSR